MRRDAPDLSPDLGTPVSLLHPLASVASEPGESHGAAIRRVCQPGKEVPPSYDVHSAKHANTPTQIAHAKTSL